jgi:hypothetical protein
VFYFGRKIAKFLQETMGWPPVSLDLKGEIWHFLPKSIMTP